jgi:hypothetical protein
MGDTSISRVPNRILLLLFISISLQALFISIFFDAVSSNLLSDDIYYYLTLSQNFLDGNGPVFNIGSPTNGFHPLYFLISTVSYVTLHPYAPEAPVVGLLSISIFAHSATGIFVYLTGRELWDSTVATITTILWLIHPAVILIVLNGMEVTVQVLIISALTYYYVKYRSQSESQFVYTAVLGLLIGIAFYARMDSVFFAIGIGISLLWSSVNYSEDWHNQLQNIFKGKPFAVGLISFFTVFPWIVWSYLNTGLITPHSGSAQTNIVLATGWGTRCLGSFSPYLCGVKHSAVRLGINIVSPLLVPFSPLVSIWNQVILSALILTTLAGIIIYWAYHNLSSLRKIDFLVISIVLHTFFYLFIHLHYRDYYGLLFYLIFFILVVPIVIQTLGNYVPKRFNVIIISTIFIMILLSLMINIVPIASSQEHKNNILTEGGAYIDEEIEQNATVGSFNSGRIQYYSTRDVINLDGVINIHSYKAIEEGRLDCYIYQNDIEYVIDFERQARDRLRDPDLVRSPVEFTINDRLGRLAVFKIEPRDPDICEFEESTLTNSN